MARCDGLTVMNNSFCPTSDPANQSDIVFFVSFTKKSLIGFHRLAIPVALTQLFQMSLGIITTLFLGRLGTVELGGGAMGLYVPFLF